MDMSVVICTYNRADSLQTTLRSLQNTRNAHRFSWEVIVVNNNSTDATESVVQAQVARAAYVLRYVFESRQGLAYARNTGVGAARGQIIAFTDDDILVDESWLDQIFDAFRDSEIGIVGGKIIPIWEVPAPRWLTPELHGILALLDRGDRDLIIDDNNLWGANVAIRAALIRRIGMFDTTLGRRPGRLFAGEETELIRRAREYGVKALYRANAIVHHRIGAERLRKSYFRKWRMENAQLSARRSPPPGSRRIFGIPHYLFRLLLQAALAAVHANLTNDSRAFAKELQVFDYLGAMRATYAAGSRNSAC